MDLTGTVEIRIQASTSLEALAQAAVLGLHCCKAPEVYELAGRILETEKKTLGQEPPTSAKANVTDPSGPVAGETGRSAAHSEKATAPAPAPAPAPKEDPAPKPATGKAPSLEDIRAKGIEAAKKYGQAAVKTILKEFNAENMTTLPEDKRAEFLVKLEGLGGGNA